MNRFARGAAATLGAASAAFAVFLVGQTWVWQSKLLAAGALLMALQGWCLLRIATGRSPNALLRKAVLLWCVSSGGWLLLTTQSYIRNHGLESWVDAAGGSGFADESGQFHLSMPPLAIRQAALSALIILGQWGSGLLAWKSRTRDHPGPEA